MSYKYGPSIVTDGLVFYVDAANSKSYDGSAGGTTWTDLVGSNNGTLTNMETNPVNAGYVYDSANGGSLVFDGSDDYIEFSELTLSSLNISNGDPITISCFFKPHDLAQNMICAFFDAPRCYIETYPQSGGTVAHWGFGNTNNATTSTAFLQTNQIYNYTATYDGNIAKGYLNGGLDSTNTIGVQSYNTNNFRIAKYSNGSPLYGDLTVYYCQLYNKALTSTEVLQNYNALKNRFI